MAGTLFSVFNEICRPDVLKRSNYCRSGSDGHEHGIRTQGPIVPRLAAENVSRGTALAILVDAMKLSPKRTFAAQAGFALSVSLSAHALAHTAPPGRKGKLPCYFYCCTQS